MTPARRLLFSSFHLPIKYAKPNCEMSGCQNDPFRIVPLFAAKSVGVNEFSYFLPRPFAPDIDNIKRRIKGETQCFAKELSGHLLKSRVVLIENRWKKVLEDG